MNDSELDQLLQTCSVPVRPPVGFERDVWCRIETTEYAGWKARFGRLTERSLAWMALPPVAVATCTAMVAVGAWFGLKSELQSAPNEVSYVRSISPFAHSNR